MRTILNINEGWKFSKKYDSIPSNIDSEWEDVNIPHTWNGMDGQDGGNDYARNMYLYAKEIDAEALPDSERIYLEFNGVNSSCDIYVNGIRMCHHDGGYSTFRTDITDAVSNGKNIIEAAVDNRASETVYPQNADFTFYGGIYRDVNIIGVSANHFDLDYYGTPGIMVTPEAEGKDAVIHIKTFIQGTYKGTLIYKIIDNEGEFTALQQEDVTFDNEKNQHECDIKLENVHLWNGREDPYLYSALVMMLDENGNKIDEVTARFGVRTYFIDADKGFFLNGKHYPLHGVSRHQDRNDIGNAIKKMHHEEDMDLICEVGANTIRLAHYQHDQYFYDLCDERGMVVWAEIPYISSHMPNGRNNTITQMKELIIQNYNHPSIVVWGLSNEITMGGRSEDLYDNHVLLNDLVHEMDKTRKTVMAIEKNCDITEPIAKIPDVVSYNLYIGWYEGDADENGALWDAYHSKYPEKAFGLSEYGAEGMNWHTDNPRKGDYTEEYQALYHEKLIKQIIERPYLWATHAWNMFDFGADNRAEGGQKGKNCKGLVTMDRRYKKDSFYAYKAWLSDVPFVHIGGSRYVDRHEAVTTIKVYSNQDAVALYVNDQLIGMNDTDKMFFTFKIKNEGESVIKAVAGECTDTITIRKVAEPKAEYIMKDPGIILNWFDVTSPKGYYSLNNTIREIIRSKEAYEAAESIIKYVKPAIESDDESMGAAKDIIMRFTLIRLSNLVKSGNYGMKGDVDKELLLSVNESLNKIALVEELVD